MSPALNGLVPCVVRDVVLLVLLEEVTGTHGVAALQQSLQWNKQEGDPSPFLSVGVAMCAAGGLKTPPYLLSDQNGRALQWHPHHFMRVPCD